MPRVSNKYHITINLDKKLKQINAIIPPTAPINNGHQSILNKSAHDAIITAPAKVALHICSILNLPLFIIIEKINTTIVDDDNAKNVFPIAKYLVLKY